MRLIGLCGRSGSGKSECGRVISKMGIEVIDSDIVYKNLIKKGSILLAELVDFFGDKILKHNGELDRKALTKIVFMDDTLLEKLNNITHKHITKKIDQLSEDAAPYSRGELVVVQAPLLFESGLNKKCDKNVCVLASDDHCLKRLQIRDGLTLEQAQVRLSKQKNNIFLKENCDYIIENNAGIEELRIKTEFVFIKILGE